MSETCDVIARRRNSSLKTDGNSRQLQTFIGQREYSDLVDAADHWFSTGSGSVRPLLEPVATAPGAVPSRALMLRVLAQLMAQGNGDPGRSLFRRRTLRQKR